MEIHFNSVQYNSNTNYSLKKGYFLSASRATEHDHTQKKRFNAKLLFCDGFDLQDWYLSIIKISIL